MEIFLGHTASSCLPLGHRQFSQSRRCATNPHTLSFVLQFVMFLYVINSLGGNCSPLTVLGLILLHMMVQSCPAPTLGFSPELVGTTARVRGELLGWLGAAGHSPALQRVVVRIRLVQGSHFTARERDLSLLHPFLGFPHSCSSGI